VVILVATTQHHTLQETRRQEILSTQEQQMLAPGRCRAGRCRRQVQLALLHARGDLRTEYEREGEQCTAHYFALLPLTPG
jgi:hypothetical protein